MLADWCRIFSSCNGCIFHRVRMQSHPTAPNTSYETLNYNVLLFCCFFCCEQISAFTTKGLWCYCNGTLTAATESFKHSFVMGTVEGSTLFPKIATIILAIALLFHLIAIGAPWWSVSNTHKTERAEHIGLWKYCSSPMGASMEQCFDFVDIITGGTWSVCSRTAY